MLQFTLLKRPLPEEARWATGPPSAKIDRCPKISLIVRVGNAMAANIHAQVTGYGPQPGNTQVLLIVTAEFDGPSVDDVHGPGTERRR